MLKFVICTLFAVGLCQAEEIEEPCCELGASPMRIEMRHIDPGGVGYTHGYTSLDGFYALPQFDCWMPFLDIRGHVFNDGEPAANLGLGFRSLDTRIYGINVYYDYRKMHRWHSNQISLGFESLGRIIDFRINGYLPVGRTHSRLFDDRFEDGIFFRKREFAMRGANGEVGFHLIDPEHWPSYFAVGLYYLNGKERSTWGGESRLILELFKVFRLEGNVSYDSIFHWIGQGSASIIIPFGPKKEGSDVPYQRVDRNEIIVVDAERKEAP